jgi:hypothetical protein
MLQNNIARIMTLKLNSPKMTPAVSHFDRNLIKSKKSGSDIIALPDW